VLQLLRPLHDLGPGIADPDAVLKAAVNDDIDVSVVAALTRKPP
jgi:hypothetical protein